MSCSNCFNGCAETISDQCIRYTGIDVPELGILHGDSLLSVENAIVNFLVPVLDGTGINPIIEPSIICDVVSKYLPTCTECTGFTLNEVLTAIIKSVCDLQDQIDLIVADIAELNADYILGCVTGVTSSAGTHDILQATINKVCAINTTLSALILEVHNQYVPITASPGHPGIDDYIQAYINTQPQFTLYSYRMIPYAAVPYFGDMGNFDGSGAGLGDYARIFLCNGQNPGVPDLRGRTLVGATTMSAATFSPAVEPGINGNPIYSITGTNSLQGANQISLGITQIPNHNHFGSTAITTITPATHSHLMASPNDASVLTAATPLAQSHSTGGNFGYGLVGSILDATVGKTSDVTLTATTIVTVAPEGSGLPHSNIQPSRGCYYIIYIP